MKKDAAEQPAQIEIVPATEEEEPILANLLELYVHDFSELLSLEIGAQGRFGYGGLGRYWSEPDRHPFLVRVNGKLAGFVLVGRVDESVWDIAEFFIVRRHRRCGVGMETAGQVWKRFPGHWQVRVMDSNTAALRFWESAIAKFAGRRVDAVALEQNGTRWRVFAFDAKPREAGT